MTAQLAHRSSTEQHTPAPRHLFKHLHRGFEKLVCVGPRTTITHGTAFGRKGVFVQNVELREPNRYFPASTSLVAFEAVAEELERRIAEGNDFLVIVQNNRSHWHVEAILPSDGNDKIVALPFWAFSQFCLGLSDSGPRCVPETSAYNQHRHLCLWMQGLELRAAHDRKIAARCRKSDTHWIEVEEVNCKLVRMRQNGNYMKLRAALILLCANIDMFEQNEVYTLIVKPRRKKRFRH